jgi:REP element-mobilizing transposase RayT
MIGGVIDHVHVLVRHHPGVALANLVRAMKSASSNTVARELRRDRPFRWQGGYGAHSVHEAGLAAVVEYVRDQKIHHAAGRVLAAFETMTD